MAADSAVRSAIAFDTTTPTNTINLAKQGRVLFQDFLLNFLKDYTFI